MGSNMARKKKTYNGKSSFFSVAVTGDKELDKRLDKLKEDVRKKIMRASMGKAGTAGVRIFKQGAPKGPTGNLKRSIGRSLKKVKGTKGGPDFQGLRMGPNVGKKRFKKGQVNAKGRAPHAHIVILGSRQGQKPNGFMKRHSGKALRAASVVLKREVLIRINKEANK